MSILRLLLLPAACIAAISCQGPGASAEEVITSYVTFYGFDDNDDGDPNNTGTDVISDPSVHAVATEDLGTYERPGTLASDKRLIPPGVIVYIPALQRYYVMEDTCRECVRNWSNDKAHVDVYVSGTGQALAACEYRLTMEQAEIILDPPSNLPVREGSACDSSRPPAPADRAFPTRSRNAGVQTPSDGNMREASVEEGSP